MAKWLQKHTRGVIGIAACVAIVGLPLSFVLLRTSQPSKNPGSPIRDLSISDFFVPSELGQISQRGDFSNPGQKQLIFIQDAHAHYEAQKHLAQILEHLALKYGLRLILLEGGVGDVDLSYIRSLGTAQTLKMVAEQYLKEGLISGEEYLQLTSDWPIVLWGIDDPTLYSEHLSVFLDLEHTRPSLQKVLAHLREHVESLKEKLLSPPLKAHEALRVSFEARTLPVGDYAQKLIQEDKSFELSEADFPQLWRFIKAEQIRAGIDLEQVGSEQQMAIQNLMRRASRGELNRLKALAQWQKEGSVSAEKYYHELAQLSRQHQLNLKAAPMLSRYFQYVELKNDLQSRQWWEELQRYERTLRLRLAATAEEAQLIRIDEGLALYERLAKLEWQPLDYQRYQELGESLTLSPWVSWLKSQAERVAESWTWQADVPALQEELTKMVRFYKAALARDAHMVKEALAKMEAENASIAVLIAGGFHTDHLRELFAEKDVAVAVVTPTVSEPFDEERYVRVLKSKSRTE